jgi:hypothetical protein
VPCSTHDTNKDSGSIITLSDISRCKEVELEERLLQSILDMLDSPKLRTNTRRQLTEGTQW